MILLDKQALSTTLKGSTSDAHRPAEEAERHREEGADDDTPVLVVEEVLLVLLLTVQYSTV